MAHVEVRTGKNGKKSYVARYTDWEGTRRKITRSTEKKAREDADALKAKHRFINDGLLTAPQPWNEPLPFDEKRKEFLAWGAAQGGRNKNPWSAEHLEKRKVSLEFWEQELGVRTLRDLDNCQPQVEAVLRRLQRDGRKANTIRNYADAIHTFTKWAWRRKYFESDPLGRMERLSRATDPDNDRRALTVEEADRLIAHATDDYRLTLKVALGSGLRANELRSLQVADVDFGGPGFKDGGLTLRAKWTKNRRDGLQPVAPELLAELRAATDGKPKTAPLLFIGEHPARDLDRMLAKADVKKKTDDGKVDFHALRVTYVTRLCERGLLPHEVQKLARHSTMDLTMRVYSKVSKARLAAAVAAPNIGQQSEGVGSKLAPRVGVASASATRTKGLEVKGSRPLSSAMNNSHHRAHRDRRGRRFGTARHAKAADWKNARRSPRSLRLNLSPRSPPPRARRSACGSPAACSRRGCGTSARTRCRS